MIHAVKYLSHRKRRHYRCYRGKLTNSTREGDSGREQPKQRGKEILIKTRWIETQFELVRVLFIFSVENRKRGVICDIDWQEVLEFPREDYQKESWAEQSLWSSSFAWILFLCRFVQSLETSLTNYLPLSPCLICLVDVFHVRIFVLVD